jgi:parvulin-like peptidyl-prolyl isomerase
MLVRAKELELDQSKKFDEAYQQAREDWIYEQFRADYKHAIRIPDDSVRAYFDQYGNEFTIPEKVRVWEILLPNKRQADSVRALTGGRSFESLAGKYSIRPGAESVGGDMGYVTRTQLGLLGDRVFSASENEVIGPVEIAGRYAILKVGDRMQSRQASYEEASADIEDRIRQKWERRALVDEIGSLKDYAGVKINWSVLYSAALSLDPEG